MITHRRSTLMQKLLKSYVFWRLGRTFNKLEHNEINLRPGHSILFLSNHSSWWDGFWAGWLSYVYLNRRFLIMMQEDHLQKRTFFRYIGGFSINKRSRDVILSLQYTASLLDDPANMVTMFPQGALESNHTDHIKIEKGIDHIVKKIKGDCQIIYSTALVDYFESLKPSVYFHLLDCGTNHDFNYEKLQAQINEHHKQAIAKQLRGVR